MPDANGKLLPGDPGYVEPGTGLMASASTGQNALTSGPSVTTYNPAQTTAEKATATGYDPLPYNVAPEQTVAEQVRRIVGSGSPLMQQAELYAREQMNARGLNNSSIAIGAGQDALIRQALPIATADAATYERAGTNTTNASLASRAFDAGAKNTASQLNAQLGTNVNLANVKATNEQLAQASDSAMRTTLAEIQADTTLSATDKQTQSAQLIARGDNATKELLMAMQNKADITRTQLTVDNQLAIAKIDQATKQFLGQLDADNRQLLQTNANAANMFQTAVKQIGDIAVSDLDPTAKANATRTQLNALNEGLKQTAAVASTEQAALASLTLGQYFTGSIAA